MNKRHDRLSIMINENISAFDTIVLELERALLFLNDVYEDNYYNVFKMMIDKKYCSIVEIAVDLYMSENAVKRAIKIINRVLDYLINYSINLQRK